MRNREERYICFINCVLQLLFAIPVIRKFFIKRKYQQSTAGNYRICSEISRIFDMAGADNVTSAADLRQNIGSLHGNSFVKDGNQQDACDFLQALIKALDEEIGCEETRDSVNHIPICVLRKMEGREFFENGFVPAYKDLSEEDQKKLKEVFNGLLDEHNSLGDIMAECDKEALSDKFNDLSLEEKQKFCEKLTAENIVE